MHRATVFWRESARDLNDSRLDWVALQVERLQVAIASQASPDELACSLIQITEAEIKQLQRLVAAQERVDDFEQVQVRRHLVPRQPQLAHLVVRLQAGQEIVEAFCRNQVGVYVKLPQAHALASVHLDEVCDALVVELGIGQVQGQYRGKNRCQNPNRVWAKGVVAEVQGLQLDEVRVIQPGEVRQALRGQVVVAQIDVTYEAMANVRRLHDAFDNCDGTCIPQLVLVDVHF